MKVLVGQRKRLVPPGEYQARIVDIRKKEVVNKKCVFEFVFEISDGVQQGAKLSGFVPAGYEAFTEYTKLYQWYLAATGDALEEGAALDLDDFKGRVLKVRCETKVSRRTKNEFSNVVEILGLVMEDVPAST